MAVFVGYFENSKESHYAQGPFVVCGPPLGSTQRIECQLRGHKCCVMIHEQIYKLIERHFGLRWRLTPNATIVDWLNAEVAAGMIVENNVGQWVPRD